MADARLEGLTDRAVTSGGVPNDRALSDEARRVAADIADLGDQPDRSGGFEIGGLLAVLGWIVLVAIVVALLVFAWRRYTGRVRKRRGEQPDPVGARRRSLWEAARQAEQSGDYEAALRLRFQGGVAGLAERPRLGVDEATPSGMIGRRLGSPVFSELASRHDEVAYGGRHASEGDVSRSREGWDEILDRTEQRP